MAELTKEGEAYLDRIKDVTNGFFRDRMVLKVLLRRGKITEDHKKARAEKAALKSEKTFRQTEAPRVLPEGHLQDLRSLWEDAWILGELILDEVVSSVDRYDIREELEEFRMDTPSIVPLFVVFNNALDLGLFDKKYEKGAAVRAGKDLYKGITFMPPAPLK